MNHPSPVTHRSIDQLEDEIISLSQRMNAQEFEFLVLVREFDIRQGWRAYHFNNCAEWLNMKCGITLATGREKVRVATALYDLPKCSKAFAEGRLSYSKARALTRVANPLNEQELLDYALPRTASQVEEYCRQLRNADRRASTPDAQRAYASRYLSCTDNGDGTLSINIELPKEMADLVMKAIEVAAADCPPPVQAEHDNASFFAHQADALVRVAHEYLAGGAGKVLSTADNYQVMVHVDELALRDMGGKSDLPVESVRRICCDASITEVTEDNAGNPLATGRKHRVVPPALKRALLARDRHCQFPGCSHEKWLDAHHVMHWADGGETSLANTMLLCSRHHRLLHEGGYTIEKNFRGEWYFRHANGRAIASFPLYPLGGTDASRDARRDTIRQLRPRYGT
ncbi:MAG: DUF222 domain-containing protein [Pseudomonadota bacterium]